MPDDRADLSASQTRLTQSSGVSAFDHGRFAPGTVLAGRYRIIGLLGRGGMGEVYRADDLTLGQSVALKFLPSRIESDRANLDRLLSEVRNARQVSHPSVCRVHDVGDVDGRHFISMEYIDGEDLSLLLRRIGRLPPDKAVEIARQLCAGLAASHERGVLHRDLKPANIMLDGRGRVRITDFGLATAVQADGHGIGEFAGTPAYMAPEQIDGKPVSVQSDIYALGLVLYEIFTGKRFHDVSSLAQLRQRHADATSVDLSSAEPLLDPAVARVIERCLEAEARRRPASCALVAASLPGEDPLAAAIAAGETPSPQLVAAASVEGVMSPRAAVLLGTAFVGLLAFAALGRWNPPMKFGMTRSAEVLSAQTRDLLAGLGYPDVPVDTASGFSYRNTAWSDPSLGESPRPWSILAAQRPAAVFFWYREQRTPMATIEMGQIGLGTLPMVLRGATGIRPENPPLEPGSIYVERGPDGSLDALHVRPISERATDSANASSARVSWSRLFEEARLDMTTFLATEPDAALALPGSHRVAWVRAGTDPASLLRVEAAELGGRPVVFRVLGPRTRFEFVSSRVFDVADRSTTTSIVIYSAVAVLSMAYLGAAFFTRRNIRLGRGDRRGAARLAKAIGILMFTASVFLAGPAVDDRVFGTLHGAAAVGLFAGGWCWAFYLAIEPYARRQWPRMLIGWSRLMAGEWRDPQVGREVFAGALAMVATSALWIVATKMALRSGVEPPLAIDFSFRGLNSGRELVGSILNALPYAIVVNLLWVVLLLFARRLLRSDLAAIGVISAFVLVLELKDNWAFNIVNLVENAVWLIVALRVGFLAMVSFLVMLVLLGCLPVFPTMPGFVGGLSWITLAAIAMPSLFGLYTALAGQSIFGDAKADYARQRPT